MRSIRPVLLSLTPLLLLAACDRGRPGENAAPPPAQRAAGEVPATGGNVYEVRITRRADGSAAFQPPRVAARRGDVIRFVRGDADGGVSFPGRNNPPGAALPSPSPLMRQPGQVYEVPVDLPPGAYTFVSLPPGAGASTGTLDVIP